MQLFLANSCPVDYEILGGFEYESTKTKAIVRFQAHKFPYTSSVYYQCNVKLCIKNAGGCDDVVSAVFLVGLCWLNVILKFIYYLFVYHTRIHTNTDI